MFDEQENLKVAPEKTLTDYTTSFKHPKQDDARFLWDEQENLKVPPEKQPDMIWMDDEAGGLMNEIPLEPGRTYEHGRVLEGQFSLLKFSCRVSLFV